LDYIIGPGDYVLYIDQPHTPILGSFLSLVNRDGIKSSSDICGLYSLTGRITPIEEEQSQIGGGLV
jgi:hypothetical protein